MPSLVIEVEGNFDQTQIDKAMFILGELVINKVKENIIDMDLIDSGAFLQGWFSSWSNNTLTIENTQPYASYLEYGTYGYWDRYGVDDFSNLHSRKRDMSEKLKKSFPKGMQPFAPVRRVIYNDVIMADLVTQAFNNI